MTSEQQPISIGQALDQGVAHYLQGDYRGAVGYFRGVLAHDPTNFEAMSRLGSCLFDMGYLFEALYWFWRAMKKNPKSPMANANYGTVLGEIGHPEESLEFLSRAAAHANKMKNASPEMLAILYNSLGNTFEKLGKYKEALVALDRGLTHAPQDPFPHYNRGIVLRKLNKYEDAIKELDLALELSEQPQFETTSRINVADVRYNRGICKLIKGDLKTGLEDYEYRLTSSENKLPNFGMPAEKKWCFDDLTNKTIVVWCEQGLGDTLQFARFLPALVSMAGRVQVVAQTSLRGFIDIPGVEVLPGGTKLENYDYWVALMSLPLMFGVTREDEFPPPLFPEIPEDRLDAASKFINSLCKADGEKKQIVGVCWSGNFKHRNDAHRSIPFKVLSQLFDVPGHVFISLQQVRPEDIEVVNAIGDKLIHPKIKDWHDTAALTVFLDKVITVDTAVAHLAGSLGTPTWTLIPQFCADWRWGLDREDSPWYPSMRLIRQERIGDWTSIIRKAKENLNTDARSA